MERGWRVNRKCLYVVFGLIRRLRVRGKMRFGASYSTNNKLLPVARHILTTGLQKYLESWHCKICKVTVTAFHCEESTHRKKKQPRDLSDAGQKSRELTTPPGPPKKHLLRAYLEMSPKCFTTATILHSFSSVQTHCAPVVCCAEWVTSFPQCILNTNQSGHSVVWWLHQLKLLPCQHMFCVHYTTMPVYSVTLSEATYIGWKCV